MSLPPVPSPKGTTTAATAGTNNHTYDVPFGKTWRFISCKAQNSTKAVRVEVLMAETTGKGAAETTINQGIQPIAATPVVIGAPSWMPKLEHGWRLIVRFYGCDASDVLASYPTVEEVQQQ